MTNLSQIARILAYTVGGFVWLWAALVLVAMLERQVGIAAIPDELLWFVAAFAITLMSRSVLPSLLGAGIVVAFGLFAYNSLNGSGTLGGDVAARVTLSGAIQQTLVILAGGVLGALWIRREASRPNQPTDRVAG